MQDAPERMNGSGTYRQTRAKSVQARSGFDLDDARRGLIAMRVRHGADTAVGHRCSNIEVMLRKGVSLAAVGRQVADLERVLVDIRR